MVGKIHIDSRQTAGKLAVDGLRLEPSALNVAKRMTFVTLRSTWFRWWMQRGDTTATAFEYDASGNTSKQTVAGQACGTLGPAREGLAWFMRSGDIPSVCNVVCLGPIG